MSDRELVKRFRFDGDSIEMITDLIRPHLEHQSDRGRPIPPEMTVMIGLRYLASNDYQIGVGDDFGVNQSTVSRCFSLFVDRLSHKQRFRYFSH